MTGKDYFLFLVADDHVLIRSAIVSLLGFYFNGCEILTASDGIELLKLSDENDFDLIITDIRMPNMDGIEAVRKISEVKPDAKILVLSMFDDKIHRKTMFESGVKGFISKGDNEEIIIQAVRTLLKGNYYIDGKEMNKETWNKLFDKQEKSG